MHNVILDEKLIQYPNIKFTDIFNLTNYITNLTVFPVVALKLGKIYQVFHGMKTQAQAEADCRRRGGQLAIFSSNDKINLYKWVKVLTYMLCYRSSLTLTLPDPSAGVSGSLDSYCRLKTLMLGHGGSSDGSYLADPTSPIPSHCTVIILFQSVAVHQLSWLAL